MNSPGVYPKTLAYGSLGSLYAIGRMKQSGITDPINHIKNKITGSNPSSISDAVSNSTQQTSSNLASGLIKYSNL
jgi:hypothetical protein